MTTIRFSHEEFEEVLAQALDKQGLAFENDGYRGSELRYHILVRKSEHAEITVEIASSIGRDGFADGAGQNSIRLWIMGENKPLAEKTQKYVTRVAGWERRLTEVLNETLDIAKAIPLCVKCGAPMKKRASAKGEFWGCSRYPNCDYTMNILSESVRENLDDNFTSKQWAKQQREQDAVPNCPQCGTPMVKRNGYKGLFWGCPKYPNCRGTRNIAEVVQPDLPMAPAKVFKPSEYQQAIFDWVTKWVATSESRSLIVEALAGSGKTTTGVEMLKLVPTNQDVLFVAFNKHIATELAKRAPSHVKVSTYHSLGYSSVRQAFGDVRVDENKVDNILSSIMDKYVYKPIFSTIKQLVSLVKANLTGTSVSELLDMADHYGIELNGDSELIFSTVAKVVGMSGSMTAVIDYDDMCWMPVAQSLPMKQYDFLFIDEAQDTNKVQIALALKSIKENGRIVAVGDRHQSLYGFRGADVNAIPNLIESLEADVLPLSITYRNPKLVVELVNQKFPEIPLQAADWAKDGVIRYIHASEALIEYKAGDMVLCRCNAPLVEPAFALIRRGVKAIIRGRDIGSNLLSLVRKMRVNSLQDLITKLTEYKVKEMAKLQAAEKNNQAQSLEDKVDTIIALSDGIDTIVELEDRIETIFSDDQAGVVFSSVHRAKGLEAEKVYLLHPELMPHKSAKKDWEVQQERNIEYVALTRTLSELIYVS